jgi:glycosyltransferase involved in cell wall biosynthesis
VDFGERFPTVRDVIDVILPVLDEADAIARVLRAFPTNYRPIVVDNGSTDRSADIARRHGARVVSEPQLGFGAACYAGLVVASADVVCFMDCDATLDPSELPRVAEPVLDGRADLMIGNRRARPGAWPMHARVANRVLAEFVRRRVGVPMRDLGPMRAARRVALLELGLQDRRFGWPFEMIVRASAANWRIGQVDVTYTERVGQSKVTGTARGTARAVRDTVKVMFT